MAVNEADVVVGALQERAQAQHAEQPRVDRDDDRSQQTEPRGTRGRGAVHSLAMLVGIGGVVLAQLAWAALLVYLVVLGALTVA